MNIIIRLWSHQQPSRDGVKVCVRISWSWLSLTAMQRVAAANIVWLGTVRLHLSPEPRSWTIKFDCFMDSPAGLTIWLYLCKHALICQTWKFWRVCLIYWSRHVHFCWEVSRFSWQYISAVPACSACGQINHAKVNPVMNTVMIILPNHMTNDK